MSDLFARRRHPAVRVRRQGYTLLELIISMTSASVLMAGLASCIFLASQGLDADNMPTAHQAEATTALSEMMSDLNLAISFSERTSTAVTFKVPDRDGDAQPETIGYSWSGVPGDPLVKRYNNKTGTLAENVQNLNLSYLERSDLLARVIFEQFTEAKRGLPSTAVTVSTPSDTTSGDLLIAAVCTHGQTKEEMSAPADWTRITVDTHHYVTLGVWWKLATSSEPSGYQFTWDSDDEQAYTWIMRFTGHDPQAPIQAWTTLKENKKSPRSPSVATTVDDVMILRLGGFDRDSITVDDPGLPGHTAITMDRSGIGKDACSGGAGFVIQPMAGDSGTSNFALTKKRDAMMVTIAIAPDSGI